MINPISLKNSKIAVLGLGKAGASAINALCRAGADIYAWDDGVASREKLQEQDIKSVHLVEPDNMPWNEIKLLIMSPGIPLTHPQPHKAVILAKKAGCKIVCDIEVLYQAQNQAKFIGITGTNGKSTTTSLTGHILKQAGISCEIGGNIGIPALDLNPLDSNGVYVIEMSSYQLDLIAQTHFNISVFLNITPDHLDRHGDINGYIAAKIHIYDQQGQNDCTIIGIDDEYTKAIYNKLKSDNKIGKIIPISTKEEVAGGIMVKNGVIYDNISGNTNSYELGSLDRLPGAHNGQNIAAAFASALTIGVNAKDIIPAIQSFHGLKHRIQLVKTINGIKFINDSKATNADATANALRAYEDIYWILGGQMKEGGIESLAEFFPKIRHAFLIGAAQDVFARTLDGKVPYTKCETMANAFDLSSEMALNEKVDNAVVLLSPACASWDQWPNFEVRGDAFCEMVESIKDAGENQLKKIKNEI